MQTGAVSVRSAALRILNSTLDDLAAAAIAADDAVVLSGNRFGAMAGDSVTVAGTAAGPVVRMDGNRFRALPADLQPFRSERTVEFRDNAVDNVDLGPFLLGAGPAVRVTGNRFACDCDPRRISVLKLNQVFPGLLPDADGGRFGRLLTDNGCAEPAGTTLAGYQDMLVKEVACKGANVTAVPTPSAPAKDAAADRGNHAAGTSAATANGATAAAVTAVAVAVALSLRRAAVSG